MDCDEYPEENLQKRVHIVGSELVDNYTVGLLLRLPLLANAVALLLNREMLARYLSKFVPVHFAQVL